jgi:ankyrin repeat protein
MESKTHNWVIFRNFINLSFSYMTFVIKENFDLNSFAMVDYLFDIEGYDYVLNRNTVFTQGSLVTGEFEKLDFILNNYNKLSPIYLESLHYQNREGKVALHLALAANNNQMVNLILNYMSKIEFAAVHLIKDIFKDLINIQNFSEYLNAIPF